MNKKGQLFMAYLVVFFVIVLVLFGLIDVFKTMLDANRGAATLNCPGTPDFNPTSYAANSTFEKLVYRPTCFVTGISLVWFVFAVIIAGIIWVYRRSVR